LGKLYQIKYILVINNMIADVSLYLDTRRELKKGTYPLKLNVFYPPNNQRFFRLDYEFTLQEYQTSYLADRPKNESKDLKIELEAIVAKAAAIAKELGDFFTFEKFDLKMFSTKPSTKNVFDYFEEKKKDLDENEQIGTSSSYDCSLKSFKAFFNEGRKTPITFLAFSAITPALLNKYERWMISQNNSHTTIGIYVRNLRHIFKIAIKDGVVHPELYPFTKYRIPKGRKVKKALSNEVLKTLYTVQLEPGSFFEKARDYWFFSYQCNGMNFRDIAELKVKNIEDTFFSFLRHKTINTARENPMPIVVPLTDSIRAFIKKYGNPDGKPNDYVFPIFHTGMTAKERHVVNQNFIRYVNQHMQGLADRLNLNIRLGTMRARHSFTTQVTRAIGLEFAQEALGHTSLKTTQNYWAGFENPIKLRMANKLLEFAD